jgi:type II secretory pathway pseudopilin PulG
MRSGASSSWGIIRNEQGLTLVELMIVLVLSMFLMASVYLTFQVQKKTSDVQQEVSAVQQDVRAVQDIMARDVRQAGCDPLMTGTPGLVEAQCGFTGLSFSMDLNSDGDVADTDEQVAYTYAGTTLSRNGTVLSNRVTGFTLTYYDANDAVMALHGAANLVMSTTDAADVRSVEISVTMQSSRKDPDLDDYIRRTMVRRVKMRNIGLF